MNVSAPSVSSPQGFAYKDSFPHFSALIFLNYFRLASDFICLGGTDEGGLAFIICFSLNAVHTQTDHDIVSLVRLRQTSYLIGTTARTQLRLQRKKKKFFKSLADTSALSLLSTMFVTFRCLVEAVEGQCSPCCL